MSAASPPSSRAPIAIVGTGLIGGSFGLALRDSGYQGEIRGFDRPEILAAAQRRGAINRRSPSLEAACRGAAVVLLALPIGAILDLLPRIAASLDPGTVVTDTGSTKRRICAAARSLSFPPGAVFLGGHPMAGRETGGIENADPRLFAGATWLLAGEPADWLRLRRQARRFITLVARVGAKPLWTGPADHDAALARLSHLPQLVSTALACHLDKVFRDPDRRPLLGAAGPGARDMLRLAASPYSLWRDILLTNSDAIDAALSEMQQILEEMRLALRGREMQRMFAAAAGLALRLPAVRPAKTGRTRSRA
ncbi:MAG TPA: prephenate dehydrogenase/arogenate dehydrogenase family protein [Terriglobales bacterium]|nr:prephenate dehydrogenase/arogenate dehydrogenase family protein [Terriglobales bacterium]